MQRKFMKHLIKKTFQLLDPFLSGSLILFSLLFIPFIKTLPYMDGNIDFVQSYDFYTGGLSRYFLNWGSVHPPFKLWLTNIFYTAFGIHPASYNLLGLLFGIIGIVSIYGLAKRLCNISAARISAFLLATSGIFLACSLFSMRDFILTSLLLAACYFYSKREYLWYGVTASIMVLTKETALLLPISILFVEICYFALSLKMNKHTHKTITKSLFLLLPVITFVCWLLFLQVNHQKPWSDWLFASTADKGTFYTILYNLATFNFLNQYAYQQWLHLFMLNFNWAYWLIAGIGLVITVKNLQFYHIFRVLHQGNQKTKTILIICLFFLAYFFTVLTIQTYTIPRYILPLIPFLLVITAWSVTTLAKRNHYLAGAAGGIVCMIAIASLLFSIDPVSQNIWGATQVFDQTLYGLNNSLSGNDGITYNMQYLFIAAGRSKYYYGSTDYPKPQYFQTSCGWMMKDPNNDVKMIHIVGLRNFPFITACTQNAK